MESAMETVTLTVASRTAVRQCMRNAFAGKKQGAQIAFETPELLFEVMTTKRWEIIRVLTGAGPVSIREAARRIGRDVHAVHRDIHALLKTGVLRKTEEGAIIFPFDAVHLDAVLKAAE
jgi:predicted transcriptional regulator